MTDDVDYVVDLARKNTHALSFIPKPRLEEYYRDGQIMMARENDDPCGFLVYGKSQTMHIYQACIQYDARRREHGLSLVARLIQTARAKGCDSISLWCADDLEANVFWRMAGFTLIGQRRGGTSRGRMHNRWEMEIAPRLWTESFHNPSNIIAPATVDRAPRKGKYA